jgi:hypothetical protein
MVTAVCAYFNPFGAAGRERAFHEFRNALDRSGIQHLCVEQLFAGVPRVSRQGDICVSTGDLMWQKECLLQIGIDEAVARGEEKIVVTDADLLFTTPDAWIRISATFELFDWFQPFETTSLGYAEGAICKRSALSYPDPVRYGTGHPGCAWAGTGRFFKAVRLDPFALLGGGDVIMTHLLATCWKHGGSSQRFADLTEHICKAVLYRELMPSILDWAQCLRSHRFRQGYTAGVHVQAIDHGSYASRRYDDRYAQWRPPRVQGGGPIPGRDFGVDETGLLAWHERENNWKPAVLDYFKGRA